MILHGFLYGLGMVLGLLTTCATLGALGWLLTATWGRLRYTRPGWWLHRHWPTPRRR